MDGVPEAKTNTLEIIRSDCCLGKSLATTYTEIQFFHLKSGIIVLSRDRLKEIPIHAALHGSTNPHSVLQHQGAQDQSTLCAPGLVTRQKNILPGISATERICGLSKP